MTYPTCVTVITKMLYVINSTRLYHMYASYQTRVVKTIAVNTIATHVHLLCALFNTKCSKKLHKVYSTIILQA